MASLIRTLPQLTAALAATVALGACAPSPDAQLLQKCVQSHLDSELVKQARLETAMVLAPVVKGTKLVHDRVECELEAPVATRSFLGTDSTRMQTYHVHLQRFDGGLACLAVEDR